MKKNIIKLVIYYILGLLLYLSVIYLTENIILNILKLSRDEVEIFLDSPIINVIFYTAVFAFSTLVLHAYDRTSVKELNEALKEMKERVKINEKQIAKINNDSSCSSGNNTYNI